MASKRDARACAPRSTISRKSASTCCPACAIATTVRSANYEWLDAIDVVNMVDACELIIHSSLERKESRGPFFRTDFPRNRQHELAGRQRSAEIRQRPAFRAAPVRASFLLARLSTCGQPRGRVVMLDMQTSPRHGASRLGQAERDDTLAGAQFPPCAGRRHCRARSPLRRMAMHRYDTFNVPYRKWMRVLDALNWIAENEATISPIAGSAAPKCAAPARYG